MSTGPFLYDDAPEALHTGTARRRRGVILAILIGCVACAIVAGALLPLVIGSATDKAKEVTGVFLKAMAADDLETAYGLLCQSERERVRPGEIADVYLGDTPGKVAGAAKIERDGKTAETVDVRWADGSTSRYTLVNQSGPHICGTRPVG